MGKKLARLARSVVRGTGGSRQVLGKGAFGSRWHILEDGPVPPFVARCGMPLDIHTLDYPVAGTHGNGLCDLCAQTLVPPAWPPAENCA